MALLAISVAVGFGQAPAVAAPTSVATLEFDGPPMQLSVKGSGGYHVSFQATRRWVTATVSGEDGFAVYSVRGEAGDGSIRARFGELGRIAVRFEPSAKVTRREPPKRCAGKPEVTRSGVFLGTIRFRGEGGYTRVATDRAAGSVTSPRRWRCRNDDKKPGTDSGAAVDEALDGPVLAGFTPGSQAGFAVLGEEGPQSRGEAIFVAGAKARLGAVKVERFTLAIGEQGSFEFDPGLATATVSPPPPFSGSAGFQRNADGTVSWSGSLAVSLPGAPDLALTGPAFSVDLARPRTAGQLFALLGQPGRTGF